MELSRRDSLLLLSLLPLDDDYDYTIKTCFHTLPPSNDKKQLSFPAYDYRVAGTQRPFKHTQPEGQSVSMEHTKSWSALFGSLICFRLWYRAVPAPTHIRSGAQQSMSNAIVQLRKRLIVHLPSYLVKPIKFDVITTLHFILSYYSQIQNSSINACFSHMNCLFIEQK